jgi:hypothetical protein
MNNATPTTTQSVHAQQQRAEAMRYASLLDWGSRAGLLALIISFAAYVFGLLEPHVPLEQLPALWGQPVHAYLASTASPTGWGWFNLAHKGDLSNLLGIALLAGCSLPPLLGLIPIYLKRRDYVYAGICAAIVTVLVLAASGLLTGGH